MEAVDKYIPMPARVVDKPFLMPIEDIFSIQGRGTVVTGRIEQGICKVGEEMEIVGFRDTRKTVVTGVEMFKKLLDEGRAGDNVGLLLRGIEKTDVERGQVIAKPGSIKPHKKFKGEVYVLSKDEGGRHTPFFKGYRPQFYFRTTDVTGVATLPEGMEMVMPGDNVSLEIELITPVAMDKGLRFAIREGGRTVGAGTVAEIIGNSRQSGARETNEQLERTHSNSPEGVRSPDSGSVHDRDRGYRQAHGRERRRADSLADGAESVHGVAVAARGQEEPGAVRDPDAQAAAGYSRADPRHGGCFDEAGSAGGRGCRDQGLWEREVGAGEIRSLRSDL